MPDSRATASTVSGESCTWRNRSRARHRRRNVSVASIGQQSNASQDNEAGTHRIVELIVELNQGRSLIGSPSAGGSAWSCEDRTADRDTLVGLLLVGRCEEARGY